ncbi:MAG: hypothetical protein CVU29_07505 [Betaproteobacteria bacterium HGW-Betaproteobacteria-22]|nr:MAG: hypothetical protein CVU29_07505 [Betaproteobacteria bacterium HGW-Betaproteobacteria-22]
MKLIKLAAVALALFTLILTIVFFTWWVFKEPIVFGSAKFDQISWIKLASTTQNECKRGDMAYDLQRNILVKGVRREAVTALLGRPALEMDNAIEYDLGKCMHVYHGLLVFFDAQGRLVNSRISSH